MIQLEAAAGFVTLAAMRTILAQHGKTISQWQMYRFVKKRRIPCCRVGSTIMVSPAAVYSELGMI